MVDRGRKSQEPNRSWLLLGSAWNIVGAMIGASLLGYLIGRKFGDFTTGTLIGAAAGLIYCGYEIWRLIRNSK